MEAKNTNKRYNWITPGFRAELYRVKKPTKDSSLTCFVILSCWLSCYSPPPIQIYDSFPFMRNLPLPFQEVFKLFKVCFQSSFQYLSLKW